MSNIWNKIRAIIFQLNNRLNSFFGKVLPWVIFICLAAAMLFDPGRDTLQISNAAFATTVVLASVTFSYARTLKDGTAIRDEVVFAGELLIRGAIIFLFASILKHAATDIPKYANSFDNLFELFVEFIRQEDYKVKSRTIFGYDILEVIISITAFIIFLSGLVTAQKGLFTVVRISLRRAMKHPGYNDSYLSANSLDRRIAALERKDDEMAARSNG